MRTIADHIADPSTLNLTIVAADQPGDGGANHAYVISGFDATTNRSLPAVNRSPEEYDLAGGTVVLFQNGPIPVHGMNGVTVEALLAICADRLKSFQAGPFACRENAVALTNVEQAIMWLHKRTYDRMRRGVEGTHRA